MNIIDNDNIQPVYLQSQNKYKNQRSSDSFLL